MPHTHTDTHTHRHTHTHTHTSGRTPLNEWSACRSGRYLSNKHSRRRSMSSAGFKPHDPCIQTAEDKRLKPHSQRNQRNRDNLSPPNDQTKSYYLASLIHVWHIQRNLDLCILPFLVRGIFPSFRSLYLHLSNEIWQAVPSKYSPLHNLYAVSC